MGNQMRNMQFALAIALIGVSHALFLPATYQNTCSHLVNGSLTCCNKDADCAGCDAEYCACWACGQDGTDVIDGRSYNCDSCAAPPPNPPHTYSNICQHLFNDTLACCNTNADCGEEGGSCWACPDGSSWVDHRFFKCDTCQAPAPTPPSPQHSNICQHLVNGSLSCCKTDADCGDEGGMCWACPGGSSYVDGRSYNCDSCAAPPPTPPHTYSNICQHLVNDTLACCNTNADCGEEGGSCWACPDGSSWVDHRFFKCDTCQALTPTPPAPPTPAPNCDWASEVLSCTVDATCSGWDASQCASSQAVSSYCRLDNHVCHFSGN